MLNTLMHELYENKEKIKMMEIRNREISSALADLAEFKDGCLTGHVKTNDYHATVTKTMRTTWIQEKLDYLRQLVGDKEFSVAFTCEYKPRSSKDVEVYQKLASDEIRHAIEAAKIVKESSVSIKIEPAERKEAV